MSERAQSPEVNNGFEVPGDYWITSSARSSSDCGIVSPSVFAFCRFLKGAKPGDLPIEQPTNDGSETRPGANRMCIPSSTN